MRRCLGWSVVPLLVGLTACSGRQAHSLAVPAPTPGLPVVTTAAGPSPAALVFPATKEGAKAIAKAYFEQINVAQTTGSTAGLRSLMASGCGCTAVASYVEKFYASGERLTGGVFRLSRVRVDFLKPHVASLTAFYDLSPGAFLIPGGGREPHTGSRNASVALNLQALDGHWEIVSSMGLTNGTATS